MYDGWMDVGWMMVLTLWMWALLGGAQVLGSGLVVEELDEWWRCKMCRYPSFSTFLFRVEFQ